MHPFAAHRLPLALVLFGLAAAGCSSGNSDVPPMTQGDRFAPQQVMFADRELADSIRIGQVTKSFDAGVLHATVPLRSATEYDQTVQYQFVYFDENHTPIDLPVGWTDVSLNANSFQFVTGTAPGPQAREFQVTFRGPRMTSVGGGE